MKVTCIEKSIQNGYIVWKFVTAEAIERQIVDNTANYNVGGTYDVTVDGNKWDVNPMQTAEAPVIITAVVDTSEPVPAVTPSQKETAPEEEPDESTLLADDNTP